MKGREKREDRKLGRQKTEDRGQRTDDDWNNL
jgi:hypothetical protein